MGVVADPVSVERSAAVPLDTFATRCTEAPQAGTLLRRCVELFFGKRNGARHPS